MSVSSSNRFAVTVTGSPSGLVMLRTGFEEASNTPPENTQYHFSGVATGTDRPGFFTIQTASPRSGGHNSRHTLIRNSTSDFRCELELDLKDRSEPWCVSPSAPTPIEQWLGYSVRLVSPWQVDTAGEVLTQWHDGAMETGWYSPDGYGHAPNLALAGWDSGKLRIYLRWCDLLFGDPSRPTSGGDCYGAGYEARFDVGLFPEDVDHWVDLVWHVVWDWRQTGDPVPAGAQVATVWQNLADHGGTGRLEVWRRSAHTSSVGTPDPAHPGWRKLVDYRGPTGQNGYLDADHRQALYYLQCGIYKRTWETQTTSVSSRVIEFDDITLIRNGGSFAEVAPPGNPF